MPDEYRLRGYPRDERLDWQTWKIQKLIAELRTEGQYLIADRLAEILKPDLPDQSRGRTK